METVSLIIVAMKEELQALLDAVYDVERLVSEEETLFRFHRHKKTYIVLQGKIGKVHTAFFFGKWLNQYRVEHVYNIGTAGGISAQVQPLDVVIANEVYYHDVDVTAFGYKKGQLPDCPAAFSCTVPIIQHSYPFSIHVGRIASGDTFLTKAIVSSMMDRLRKETLCAEMESAAVAHICYLAKLPCTIIRSISDTIHEQENAIAMDRRIHLASHNVVEVLLAIL